MPTLRVWLAAAASLPATAAFVWAVVGDLSEMRHPDRADYLWHPVAPLVDNAVVIGAVSAAVLLASATTLVRARHAEATTPVLVAAGVVAVYGAWLGFGYRVMTAGVMGANIGGGMFMLATPVIGLVVATIVGACWWTSRNQTKG